jgi:hypothetical protein
MTAKLDGEPQINVALTIDAPPELLAQRGCDAEQASELDETEEVLSVATESRQGSVRHKPASPRLSAPQGLTAWPERNDSNF